MCLICIFVACPTPQMLGQCFLRNLLCIVHFLAIYFYQCFYLCFCVRTYARPNFYTKVHSIWHLRLRIRDFKKSNHQFTKHICFYGRSVSHSTHHQLTDAKPLS